MTHEQAPMRSALAQRHDNWCGAQLARPVQEMLMERALEMGMRARCLRSTRARQDRSRARASRRSACRCANRDAGAEPAARPGSATRQRGLTAISARNLG